jgi:Icc-related predicted phosphoesterase
VFFATDLHGSDAVFRKLLNTTNSPLRPDIIVIGGDVSGKKLVPVLFESGRWSVEMYPERKAVDKQEEVASLLQWIADRGGYAVVTTANEWEELTHSPKRVEDLLRAEREMRMRSWIRSAKHRFQVNKCEVLMNLGNDDPFYLDKIFVEEGLELLEGRAINITESVQMVSCGYANRTPWYCPRDVDDDSLLELLDAAVSRLDEPRNAIFNFHCPPFGSGLDNAVLVDENLKPKLGFAGPIVGPVGSKAVRRVIEKFQPLITLHGHIHEAFASTQLGRTVCCNPGSEYEYGLLRGVLVILDGARLVQWSMFRETEK